MEVTILRMCNHEHIIKLETSLECPQAYYMVLEKCSMDLYTLKQQRKQLTEDEVRVVTKRLSDALLYIHNQGIAHRDVKLENVLVGTNPTDPNDHFYVKLIDFGLAAIRKGKSFDDMLEDVCGTPAYIAPEVWSKRSYSQLCDTWSLGVILFYLVTGKMPFKATEQHKLPHVIIHMEPKYNPSIWGTCEQAMDICKKMLMKDPAFRLTAAEIHAHDWTNNRALENTTGEKYKGNILEMMAQCSKDCRLPIINQSEWMLTETSHAEPAFRQSKNIPLKPSKQEQLVQNIVDEAKKLNINQKSATESEDFTSSEGDTDSNDSDDPKYNWLQIVKDHKAKKEAKLTSHERGTKPKDTPKNKKVGIKLRTTTPANKKPKVPAERLRKLVVNKPLRKKSQGTAKPELCKNPRKLATQLHEKK